MHFTLLNEKDFFNPYYRKKQITQNEFDTFSKALMQYLERLESSQSENEDYLVANTLSPFLTTLNFKTHIKTKQKGKSEIDLAIAKDELSKDLEVLIEAKKPNSKEFITHTKPNSKALHEAILYYFRNREHSFSLKFIIITDFYKFYIFKASEFEELFYKNTSFKKLFEEFQSPNSLFKGNTDEFYKEASKLIENSKESLKGFFIDLAFLKDKQKSNFKNLASIFKTFHRDFLLNEFSPNDANSLNNAFYKELLYILGLSESKQLSKFIITQSEQSKQAQGTLYHLIASKLPKHDFEEVLKFIILWLNRILFLKLIESNLVRFNDDKTLKFLNYEKIPNFTTLSHLFFDILAKEKHTRTQSKFSYLPYLNSSLFEKQAIEKTTLEIATLENDALLEYHPHTQLKDDKGKSKKGKVGLLEYLFEFLDSFDFGADEQSEELIKQKELINSSVLGNVFEKLNGYKEGSFYTPSFITSYMCKASIEKVVLDKFNHTFKLNATKLSELRTQLRQEKISQEQKLALLNSIRICDPAVGSGHFLVSVLNAMLMVHYELGLFEEDFYLSVQNDEILVQNHKGQFLEYKRPDFDKDKTHLCQKELFERKKDIIENNLFGVDINPNSCEITKLRLWIELLKHSFYESFDDTNYHDLKTLPNIDINIKCGNSLISYFEIHKSLSHYPNIKERMDKYKRIVKDYKEGFYTDKTLIAKEIKNLKESFKNFCLKDKFAKEIKQLTNGTNEYSKKYGDFLAQDEKDENFRAFFSKNMFEFDFDESAAKKEFKKLKKLYESIFDLESANPFEWRFEFSEVLDEGGNFQGFDLIIGNPPYIRQEDIKELKPNLAKNYKVYKGTSDIYIYFYELGFNVLKQNGVLSFITSNKYTRAGYGEALREFLLKNTTLLEYIDLNGIKVFESATVDTSILSFEKAKTKDNSFKYLAPNTELLKENDFNIESILDFNKIAQNSLSKESFTFNDESTNALKAKIEKHGTPLKDWHGLNINYGIKTGYNEAFIITTEKRDEILAKCKDEVEKERTAKLIRKMLRGRDIKRYSYEWAGLWVINTHNGYKSKSGEKIEAINIDEYPSLKQHLKPYYKTLEKRTDKGKTPYNLRNCAYLEEFEKEKIVYSEIVRKPQFYLDTKSNFYAEATSFILTGENLKYLIAFLNNDFVAFMFKMFYAGGNLGENGFRYKKAFLERLPIPKINSKNEKLANELISLVDEILNLKEQDKNANTKTQEDKINSIVYKLYNLNEEEIKIIEGK
ncbi:Eco57I restriction-modification methylase domain-containing protein [Campylobacter sp. IFREMER_LSEM_CL1846]|uniref:type IIG restriction enzyme/methyltransferase n=1 Tax=Campylobacter sp. IFREMER_LSEM_CL1846 TaxID=2911614 RepID=UPI0021E68647|nr:Eco57I restriction-modification methylase domain-containing protein [Campylobacter sp. IFREMER_LSEM_CL1846]HEC1748132.1 class I SAM-dependent DNA methyltransferase [Campylobacter lari]MCV3433841.1 Eco57I restriction-modification methylase domain-containing protein [Campylobacter sp. IFREMER_LSEM_CL1846]HEC1769034.1 class I SAM-dependent DNA methyltransferase [Campylobacter lari]HEC1789822.1 class I SAM-dependent DNA methyltransferase [Campylobacter lari]HEC1795399.1 class I SAM-dependent DN